MNTTYLKELFQHCNSKYFDGKLPEPELRVSHSRTRLGTMSCRRTTRTVRGRLAQLFTGRSRATTAAFTDYKISISDYYAMTDEQIEDVMIHEMIHYSIAYTGLRDSSPHGVVFRGMMDVVNRKYGRHVSVMTSTRGWQPRRKPKPQTFLVLGLKMSDGSYFLSSVNPKFAGQLEIKLQRVREVTDHKWVQTTDEYFRTFPRVRSLRGRRVTKDVYESKMYPSLK